MAKLNLSIRTENLERVRAALDKLSGEQAKQAYANAINDAAKKVQAEMRRAITSAFDRPTPFITKSIWRTDATPDRLYATVAPTYARSDTSYAPLTKGGKIGVDPQDVLQAQELGGRRRDKKSEAILRRAGILPAGWQTAIPDTPFPGSDDGNGNITGTFIRSVLAFLQTFSKGQGYFQNMGPATKANVRQYGKGKVRKAEKQLPGPHMGRRYFISYGTTPSPFGQSVVRTDSGLKYGTARSKHIGPGIWAAVGSGSNTTIRAVLIFVRTPKYTPRISMERISKSADLQEYLDRRVRARIRNLAEGKSA